MAVFFKMLGFLAFSWLLDEIAAIPCTIGQQPNPRKPGSYQWVIPVDDPCQCTKLKVGGVGHRTSPNHSKTYRTVLQSTDAEKVRAWLNCATECSEQTGGPLGMESRAIPDDWLTASSVFLDQESTVGPQKARLNLEGMGAGWTAKSDNHQPWIQVDFQTDVSITGLITQGRGDISQWVESYVVKYSDDGLEWQFVLDKPNGQTVKFAGNSDSDTHVTNRFAYVLRTRFLRILPATWHAQCSMRFEVTGCEA